MGVQLCPSAPGGGAGVSCAATSTSSLAARPLSDSAAVPGSASRQQREEELSRSSRRRRRSSSGGRSPIALLLALLKKIELNLFLPPLDVCLEVHRPAPVGDRLPRPGPSGWWPRSSTVADRYRFVLPSSG